METLIEKVRQAELALPGKRAATYKPVADWWIVTAAQGPRSFWFDVATEQEAKEAVELLKV